MSQFQHVGRITQTTVWVGMHLEEEACGTEGLCSHRHLRYEAAVAPCLAVAATRSLHAMRTVHDHRRYQFQHIGDVAEVNHQVVVAHHITTFREPYLFSTSLAGFLHGISHILATQELCLLDIHGAPSLGSSHE